VSQGFCLLKTVSTQNAPKVIILGTKIDFFWGRVQALDTYGASPLLTEILKAQGAFKVTARRRK